MKGKVRGVLPVCCPGCPSRWTGPAPGTVGLRVTCFVCTSVRCSGGWWPRAASQSRSVPAPKHAGRVGIAPYRSRPGVVLTPFQGPAGVAVRPLCQFGERLLGVPPAPRGASGSARCGSAARRRARCPPAPNSRPKLGRLWLMVRLGSSARSN